MHKLLVRLLLISLFLFTGIISFAQDNMTTEPVMRSHGKIYVVMAVCLTILFGLIIYIISIDKKIGKIEDKN